jgi:hypothetical protein
MRARQRVPGRARAAPRSRAAGRASLTDYIPDKRDLPPSAPGLKHVCEQKLSPTRHQRVAERRGGRAPPWSARCHTSVSPKFRAREVA